MFKSILKFIGSIGSAIGSFFNYIRERNLIKALDEKHEAEMEVQRLEENIKTEELKKERKEDISIIEEKVKTTKKPKKNRTTRVIEG